MLFPSILLIMVSACRPPQEASSITTLVAVTAPPVPTDTAPALTDSHSTPMLDPSDEVGEPATEQAASHNTSEMGVSHYTIVSDESLISYGVGETFINQDNRYNYAVGTTNAVSGEIVVNRENPNLSQLGTITVDISSFVSDKARRDKAIRADWLQSAQYPLATFSPTEMRQLPDSYMVGETISFEIVGDLLVRDTSSEVLFTITATLDGDQLIGMANTQVQMTDFGFSPPSIAGILEAENEVDLTFEFTAVEIQP